MDIKEYWVLRTNKDHNSFIHPTHSDWGPDYLPAIGIAGAETFSTEQEAMRWASAPGNGWDKSCHPVKVRMRVSYELTVSPRFGGKS